MARDAAPDHLAIDLTKRPALPRHAEIGGQAVLPPLEPAPIMVEPLREIPDDVLAALESQLLDMDQTSSVSDAPDLDDMTLPPLNLDRIRERYPLLHNAL